MEEHEIRLSLSRVSGYATRVHTPVCLILRLSTLKDEHLGPKTKITFS